VQIDPGISRAANEMGKAKPTAAATSPVAVPSHAHRPLLTGLRFLRHAQ